MHIIPSDDEESKNHIIDRERDPVFIYDKLSCLKRQRRGSSLWKSICLKRAQSNFKFQSIKGGKGGWGLILDILFLVKQRGSKHLKFIRNECYTPSGEKIQEWFFSALNDSKVASRNIVMIITLHNEKIYFLSTSSFFIISNILVS